MCGAVTGLTLVDGFAFTLAIFTLGLAYVALIAVSFLFFLLLLFIPTVLVRSNKARWVMGGFGLVVAFGLMATGSIAFKFSEGRFLVDPIRANRSLAADVVIDIAAANEDGCGALCWRLLTGEGVAAVVVSEDVSYARVDASVCQSFEPMWDDDQACLVTQSATEQVPDISLEIEYDLPDSSFFYQLEERTIVRILARDSILYQDSGLTGWIRSPWPTLTLDKHGSASYRMAERFDRRNAPSMVEAFTSIGIRPSGPAPVLTEKIHVHTWERPAPRPQDRMIVASAVKEKLSFYDSSVRSDAERYLIGLNDRHELDVKDVHVLTALAGSEGGAGLTGLGRAIARLPGRTVAGLPPELLYQRVSSGTIEERVQATALISKRILSAPPGKYAEEAELYQNLLRDNPNDMPRDLAPLTGRFGFDPLPRLRIWMSMRHAKEATLNAACFAGPKWDKGVVDLANSFLEQNGNSRAKSGGTTQALRILETRGFTDQVNNWIDEMHIERRRRRRRLSSLFPDPHIEAMREAYRRSIIGKGCDGNRHP